MSKLFLKLQNTTVMSIDVDMESGSFPDVNTDDWRKYNVYDIKRRDLLPFYLRTEKEPENEEEYIDAYYSFFDYLNNRIFEYGRVGFKELAEHYNIPDHLTGMKATQSKYIQLRGLSASDDYWLTFNEEEKWENVNPRTNLVDINIARLAVGGLPLRFDEYIFPITTEYSGKGVGKRRWVNKDGSLVLRKYNSYKNENTLNNLVCVSELLSNSGIDHVSYKKKLDDFSDLGEPFIKQQDCCECDCLANNRFSFVSMSEIEKYIEREHKGIGFFDLLTENNKEDLYKILITSYISGCITDILYDVGFLMDNKTGELVKIAPFFGYSDCFNEVSFEEITYPSNNLLSYADKKTLNRIMNNCNFNLGVNPFFAKRYKELQRLLK